MIQHWFYGLMILSYRVGIGIASIVNRKAKLWISGRRNWIERLETDMGFGSGRVIWVHAASLGEFEQGRPVIDLIRGQYPQKRILLTFFSPSGYEVRKNYPGVDMVHYLPLDTGKNAKRFLDIINPELAIFIKYEFWFNHLFELNERGVPTLLVSGRLHSKQGFFRSWGGFFKKGLKTFNHFFLQDQASAKLLSDIGFSNHSVNGDTRYDRVKVMQSEDKRFPEIEEFCGNDEVIVLGSSWLYDELLMQKYISGDRPGSFKLILAPHDIDEKRMSEFQRGCEFPSIRLSKWSEKTGNEKVLLIDSVGKLSYIYRYASVAMIGGGFGAGIHNTLEAAVWSCPIVFGPRYEMFNEAVYLLENGAAFSVESQMELDIILDRMLFGDDIIRSQAGKMAGRICESGQGASEVVVNYVKGLLSD